MAKNQIKYTTSQDAERILAFGGDGTSSFHSIEVRTDNIAVTNIGTGAQAVANDFTAVAFKKIPEDVIARLIQEGNVFSWAGGFAVEDPFIAPYVESIEGEEGSTRGLPKALTEKLMKEAGS